jgi:hypothetical protein
LNFQQQKSFKIIVSYIVNSNLTKKILINPTHIDLSNNTNCTFQFLLNFQLKFNLIFSEKIIDIQELLHCKSKRHGMKPMHPSSSRAFQRNQERDLKHLDLVDLIGTNKTNKQPSFVDRFACNQ